MAFALQAPEVDVRELGPLPIVMHYLRRMEVKKVIDDKVPPHALQTVTHGECVEALLCAIFLGTHTLSHVAKTLSKFDLPHLFEHPGLSSEQFNDTRLGEALDALYGKTESLYADVVIRGIHAFDLVIRRLHTDSTTLKLFGAYNFADEIEASHLPPPPKPTFGKSKDHRPDLKQLLLSLSVSNEGCPIYGRVTDGNISDVTEFRLHLEKLASMLDDLREIVLVADCKLCTDPTLVLAHDLGFNLVTLLPDNYSLRRQLIEEASREAELPLLLKTAKGEEYHGKSYKIPFSIENMAGRKDRVYLRFLVIHSTQLGEQRTQTRLRGAAKERKALEKVITKAQKTPFACEPDAQKVAATIIAEAKAKHHVLYFSIEARQVVRPAPKGRRPRGLEDVAETRFFLKGEATEIPRPQCRFDPEGMFVLLTTISDRRELSDTRALEAYKGQQTVEIGFHWLKGPLEVAPVFLKKTTRIDVLGFVYLISMFLYAVVQRDLRREVKNQGVEIVGPCQEKTVKPTTRALFKIFEGVDRVVVTHEGRIHSETRYLTTNLRLILEIMNWQHLYFIEKPAVCT